MAAPPRVYGFGDGSFCPTPSDDATRPFVPLYRDGSPQEVAKGIDVVAVVVFVARFDDVSGCMALAVVVVLSKYRSLYQRPEAFNRVSMDKPFCVGNRMIDGHVRNPFVHTIVGAVPISDQNTVIGLHELSQETLSASCQYLVGGLGNDLAAPCQCSDN